MVIYLRWNASVKSVALGYLSSPFFRGSAGSSGRLLNQHDLLLSLTQSSCLTGPIRDRQLESTDGFYFLNAR